LPQEVIKNEKLRINGVFKYFSKETLDVVKKACDLIKDRKKAYLTPWQILNIIIEKNDLGIKIDKKSLEMINVAIEKNISESKNSKFKGVVFFSPETIKILLAAYFVSKQQMSNKVENSHLLSALSAYPEMQNLFQSLNFTPENIVGSYIPETLGKYSTDLMKEQEDSKDIVIERESELENVMRILVRKNKNHIILLGEEGVGKSIIGVGLARFLNKNNFPNFSGVRVITLDLGNLLSLTSNIISAEKITEEIGSMGKTILFFNNANLLTTDIQISRLVGFLQDLEKKGNVYFIIPATPVFYKEYLSANPYFSAYFETVKIEELSSDNTEQILKSEAVKMEKNYRLTIDYAVFKEITFLSKRYISGSLPQKAISLLEEVCASVSLKSRNKVGLDDVKNIVSQKTGIPLSSLTESESEKLKNLESLLGKYVIGQKEAIKKVSESLRRARAGLKDPKKPIGSFLFLGPTGVGKTELAKTLARLFFNDEKSFLRFDMSEYAESHTAQRLVGSPPGYVGYEEGGQLTNRVLERPYSLILFDEIEKAHPRVFDLFLQILDDGRLSDAQGRVVDFKNTLIIFTSNIASQEIYSHSDDLINPKFERKTFLENVIMPIVREYFRPELINRFDDIIMFNPLNSIELIEIAKLKIDGVKERLKDKKITLELSDKKLAELVNDSYNPALGARPLERAIRDKIENVIAEKIILGEIKEGEVLKW
jgi:ATP-dependent Clp protease ATP-binding subunit ClpC